MKQDEVHEMSEELSSKFLINQENERSINFMQSSESKKVMMVSPNIKKIIKKLPQLQKQQEQPQVNQRCKVMLHPDSRFIICWDILNIFLIYIYFMEIPITIAFENHRSEDENQLMFRLINIPAMAVFTASIFINFNTSYYSGGVLIDNLKFIRKNYMKGAFIIDLVSVAAILTYEISQFVMNKEENKQIPHRFIILLFYLKMFELLRKERSIINSFDLNRRVKGSFKLILLLTKIFLICNIGACGFFYISDSLKFYDKSGVECTNCTWVTATMFNNQTLKKIDVFGIQYTYSLYWASTTMISIGYGDITPRNSYEISYTILIQFFSCLLYAYAINEIWSIIQELNAKKDKIHHRLNIINVYMRDKNISDLLTDKVNAYLTHYYYQRNLRQREMEEEIISELTPQLKKQLFFQSYGHIFHHLFFNKFDQKWLQLACSEITEVGYFQEEFLITPDLQECHQHLYYIKKGQLQHYFGSESNKMKLKTIESQETICIFEFITQVKYSSHLKALKYTLLYKLKYQSWNLFLRKEQLAFQSFHQAKFQLLLRCKLDLIRDKCYFCQSEFHRSQFCFIQGIGIKGHSKEIVKKCKLENFRKKASRSVFKHKSSLNDFENKNFSKKKTTKIIQLNIDKETRKRSRKLSQNKIQFQEIGKTCKKQLKTALKKNTFQRQLHFQRIKKIMEQKKRMEELESEQVSESDEEIIVINCNVDKATNYQRFYSKYNCDEELRDFRRRMTQKGVFLQFG